MSKEPEIPVRGNIVDPDVNTPTGYYLESVKIKPHNDDEFDITNMVAFFNISETISDPQIQVRISIGDAVNFIGNKKLSGDEKVSLVVKRRLPGNVYSPSGPEQKIELNLRVIEILNFVRTPKPGFLTYVLNCVSEYVCDSNKIIVKNAFGGQIGTLIKNLATNSLNIKGDELDIDDKIGPDVKGIYPRIKPLNAMRWLKQYSVTENSPVFLYQTNDGVLRLKSYAKMIEEYDKLPSKSKEYFTYDFRPNLRKIDNENEQVSATFDEQRIFITSMVSAEGPSKFISIMGGVYASNTHKIDISNKTFSSNKYSYNINKSLESNQSHSKEMSYEKNANAKSYYISTNEKSYDNKTNIHHDNERHVVNSKLSELKSHQHVISLPGDFELKVGQVINLKMYVSEEKDSKVGHREDKFAGGKYLIISIAHAFAEKYLSTITIVRDTVPENIDEQ